MAMRSRLAPFKKFARTLREHQRELLNGLLARGQFAAGATEWIQQQGTNHDAEGLRLPNL